MKQTHNLLSRFIVTITCKYLLYSGQIHKQPSQWQNRNVCVRNVTMPMPFLSYKLVYDLLAVYLTEMHPNVCKKTTTIFKYLYSWFFPHFWLYFWHSLKAFTYSTLLYVACDSICYMGTCVIHGKYLVPKWISLHCILYIVHNICLHE